MASSPIEVATKPARPDSCPDCPKGLGLARTVTIKDSQRTITYVCDTCQHTWDVTEPITPEGW